MPQQYFDQADIEKNKTMAALGYIIPVIPMVACKDSPFGRFCANQGLIFWGCALALKIVAWIVLKLIGWLPLIGWLLASVFNLAQFAFFCVAAYYAYIAYSQGKANELPIVGSLRIWR